MCKKIAEFYSFRIFFVHMKEKIEKQYGGQQMIFATYQPKNPDKSQRSDNALFLEKLLGYYPAFCFSANVPQEAIVGSILSAPNYPEVLYFVDVIDCDYVDVVQWCLFVKTRDERYAKAAINNGCDVIFREYLIPAGYLGNNIPILSAINIADAVRGEVEIDFPLLEEMHQEYREAYLNEFETLYSHIKYATFAYYMNSLSCTVENLNESCKEDKAFLDRTLQKKAFETGMMGLFSHIVNSHCKKQGVYVVNANAMTKRTHEITTRLALFYNPDCSASETTYKKFRYLYEMISSFVWNANWSDDIERNDKCPCGCGKKFKKCHGRYV